MRVCGDADMNRTRFFFAFITTPTNKIKSYATFRIDTIPKPEHYRTPAMSCEVAFTRISFFTQQSRNYHNAKHRISFFTPTPDKVIITCVSIVTHTHIVQWNNLKPSFFSWTTHRFATNRRNSPVRALMIQVIPWRKFWVWSHLWLCQIVIFGDWNWNGICLRR